MKDGFLAVDSFDVSINRPSLRRSQQNRHEWAKKVNI